MAVSDVTCIEILPVVLKLLGNYLPACMIIDLKLPRHEKSLAAKQSQN